MPFDDCSRVLADVERLLGGDVERVGTTAAGEPVYRPKGAEAAHALRELGLRFGTWRVTEGLEVSTGGSVVMRSKSTVTSVPHASQCA